MRVLERALSSNEDEYAATLAAECARTLLAYHDAENDEQRSYEAWIYECERTFMEYRWATESFEAAFPNREWRDFVDWPRHIKDRHP
jgi:hypothetical protein